MKRLLPLLLLLIVFSSPVQGDSAQVPPGMNRYRVTVDTAGTDDVSTLIRQLAAMCRGRVESHADGAEAFVVIASDAGIGVLRSDSRVVRVEPLTDRSGSGGVTTTAATGVWATGPYAYDGAGNISGIGRTSSAIGQRFVYDAYGRLTSGMAGDQKQTYTYDRFGNIRTISRATVTGTAQSPITTTTSAIRLGADAGTNRLSLRNIAGQAMNASADYDGEGRLTAWHTSGGSYTYDALGMITTWSGAADGKLRRYIYTPSEERLLTIAVAPGGSEVSSEWTLRDAGGKVLRRLQRSGGQWSWKQDYIYLNGSLLAAEVDTSAKTLHFFSDHLGTPRLITGNGGVQISRHDYLAFGEEVTASNQDAERLKFTGHERDESALDYMHARYYSSGTGRFISVDPTWSSADKAQSQSWNRYTYVRNNPANGTDPDGRMPIIAWVGRLAVEYAAREIAMESARLVMEGTKIYAMQVLSNRELLPRPQTIPPGVLNAEDPYVIDDTRITRIPDDRITAPPDERGHAPIGDDGFPIEIHHVNQKPDGPLVELTRTDHRGKGNFGPNHPNTGQSPSQIDRKEWMKAVRDYWKREWDRGRFIAREVDEMLPGKSQ